MSALVLNVASRIQIQYQIAYLPKLCRRSSRKERLPDLNRLYKTGYKQWPLYRRPRTAYYTLHLSSNTMYKLWVHSLILIQCIKHPMAAFAWNDVLPITLGLWHVWWDERKSCDWLYILTVQGFLPFLECPTTTLENQNSSLWNAACGGSPGDLALIFKIPREILGTPTLTPKFRAAEQFLKCGGRRPTLLKRWGEGRGKFGCSLFLAV